MKKIVLVVLGCVFTFITFAQKSPTTRQEKKNERKEKIAQLMKQEEEGALIFHKQNAWGIKLTSDGYAAFYELGKLKTTTLTNLYSIEIGEHKHPKEERLTRGNFLGFAIGNPYVYGKINNFYFTKLGIGQQRLIGGKGNKNGVAVSAIYGGGLSAGLLKPYYLDVNRQSGGGRYDVKYNNDDSTRNIFLRTAEINGASGFTKGFNEMKFVPGVFAKAAMRFDYGRYNELLSAVEVGVNVEWYSQKMPILLLTKEKQLFVNAYAAIVFGKRK